MDESVQVSAIWRKAAACADGACVEVAIEENSVRVRNSEDCEGPVLTYTHSEWMAFLTGIRCGEFEIPESG